MGKINKINANATSSNKFTEDNSNSKIDAIYQADIPKDKNTSCDLNEMLRKILGI